MISETLLPTPFPTQFPTDAHSGREPQVREHGRKKALDPEYLDFPVSKPLTPAGIS